MKTEDIEPGKLYVVERGEMFFSSLNEVFTLHKNPISGKIYKDRGHGIELFDEKELPEVRIQEIYPSQKYRANQYILGWLKDINDCIGSFNRIRDILGEHNEFGGEYNNIINNFNTLINSIHSLQNKVYSSISKGINQAEKQK